MALRSRQAEKVKCLMSSQDTHEEQGRKAEIEEQENQHILIPRAYRGDKLRISQTVSTGFERAMNLIFFFFFFFFFFFAKPKWGFGVG